MPDQDTKPTSVESSVEVEQSLNFGKILRTLVWVVPVLIVIVIVVLALLGPAVGTIYSNITPSM